MPPAVGCGDPPPPPPCGHRAGTGAGTGASVLGGGSSPTLSISPAALLPSPRHDRLSLTLAFNSLGEGVGGWWSRVGGVGLAWGSRWEAAAGREQAAAHRDPPQVGRAGGGQGIPPAGEGLGAVTTSRAAPRRDAVVHVPS